MVEMNDFQKEIWLNNYKAPGDNTILDTFKRVSKAIASALTDPNMKELLLENYFKLMCLWKFLPGGRITANAGVDERGKATLYNCYVYNPQDFGIKDIDSMEVIFDTLKKSAKILASEGGLGINATYLRPNGSFIKGTGARTPGVVKFLLIWDKASLIITMGSTKEVNDGKKAKKKIRKGALMGVLADNHSEIKLFITAKQQSNRLSKFNLSVLVTDKLMNAVINNEMWDLCFPDTLWLNYKELWDGDLAKWVEKGYPVNITLTLPARLLWDLILRSTYTRNEPGVLFYDTLNDYNPIKYTLTILTTNPCGEIGMSSGVCNLGSLNLPAFHKDGKFDYLSFELAIKYGICFLDGVCDISYVPLKLYEQKIKDFRRVGLGVTGLGSLLSMLGIKFGTLKAIQTVNLIFKFKCLILLLTSALLGKTKGSFLKFNKDLYFSSKWWYELPISYEIKRLIEKIGCMRNAVHSDVPPSGNCQIPSTRIITTLGIKTLKLIFLENDILLGRGTKQWYLVKRPFKVLTMNGFKNITKLYDNCNIDTFKIITQNNRVILGTAEHKVLIGTVEKNYWSKLLFLKVGNTLLIKDGIKYITDKILSIFKTNNYTCDILVLNVHHYILLNGIISHNSSVFLGQVSNGILPVFMQLYTRWVSMTNELKQELGVRYPEPQLGLWFETDIFKATLRGNLLILRGAIDGVTYLIDKGRGMIKPMKVMDYGYRKIKLLGLPLDGLVDINLLTVLDHINMLAASAKYINQNQSKTINIPLDYTYLQFKNVYMDAWKKKIKGVTTYRAGTMTAVLLDTKKVKTSADLKETSLLEKLFKETNENVILSDVKIPSKSYALQYKVKDKNKKKWYFTVSCTDKLLTRPFAIFIRTNHKLSNEVTDMVINGMLDLLLSAGIRELLVKLQRCKYLGQSNIDKIGRAIGMALRHNIPLIKIVLTLQLHNDGLSTLLFNIRKILSSFIVDGTKIEDKVCLNCGSKTLIYQSGCSTCSTCGNSKCS